uniref:Uncharacterized protein n=1 Tax=Rhizophora mucronata TaxID=61149 RepID=A0A2P2QT68_RHIMU
MTPPTIDAQTSTLHTIHIRPKKQENKWVFHSVTLIRSDPLPESEGDTKYAGKEREGYRVTRLAEMIHTSAPL